MKCNVDEMGIEIEIEKRGRGKGVVCIISEGCCSIFILFSLSFILIFFSFTFILIFFSFTFILIFFSFTFILIFFPHPQSFDFLFPFSFLLTDDRFQGFKFQLFFSRSISPSIFLFRSSRTFQVKREKGRERKRRRKTLPRGRERILLANESLNRSLFIPFE